MKIPKTLKINGKDWTLGFEDLPENEEGGADFKERHISLSNLLLEQDDIDETLLHEILHACLGPEVDVYMKDGLDELLVMLLAPRLLDVLKQMGAWK